MFNRFLFCKNGGGANKPLLESNLFKPFVNRLSLFAAFWLATTFSVDAQLPANSFNCPTGGTPTWFVEIVPISTPTCGEVECNLNYFQVRLRTGLSIIGNPASFLLKYEDFSLTIKMVTDPAGGLSAVNQGLTEDCYPSAYQDFPLGFDPGNEVTFFVEGDCSTSTTPNILFTRAGSGPPYIAELFVIAVEGVPGEDILFELTQSEYTCPDVPVYCTDVLFLDSDAFTFPSPTGAEPNVCVTFGDYDTGTHLLPVKATNSSSSQIDVDYLTFSIVMEADNIMQTPVLKNFSYPAVESSVTPIPSTDDWLIFVRFDVSAGISVLLTEEPLFDIEIKGPVNQSLAASVELCLSQGQIRRKNISTCRNACLDTDCAEINFGGFEPCDPNNFTVVVEAEEMGSTCEELEVKVMLNWSSYASTLDFDKIRIAVEFDLPAGVTIIGPGTNTFGCPANPTCNPGGGFSNCFKVDGNLVTFCFFPNTPQSVDLGDYFTVLFDAPSNCINGAIIREASVDVSTSPPGGSECATNAVVESGDFPLCTPLYSGWVKNTDGAHVDNVNLDIFRIVPATGCSEFIWPNNSDWSYCPCDAAQHKVVPEVRTIDWLDGVTTYDLTLIGRHLNGTQPFTSIYQYAAADANNNRRTEVGSGISSPDVIDLRKLILGLISELPGVPMMNNPPPTWWYFDENSTGSLPADPILDQFTLPNTFWQGSPSNTGINFIAVKVGDLNNSHNTDTELRPAGVLPLRTEALVRPSLDEYLSIPIRYEGDVSLSALQMGLRFDAVNWEFIGVSASDVAQVSAECFNLNHVTDGEIKFAWFCSLPDDNARPGQTLFFLTLRAKKAVKGALSPLQVDDSMMRSIAYTPEGVMYNLNIQAEASRRTLDLPSAPNLQVVCAPNPSSGAASLTINTANETSPTAMVWAYSAFGTRLLRREIPLTGRTTTFQFPESEQWPAGLYVWKVKIGDEKTEGRLIKQ